MSKPKVVILYKDKSYNLVSMNKLKANQLKGENIKLILIPLYDDPNAYIPIKPSYLYGFYKVKVRILYQASIYSYEHTELNPFDYSEEFDVDKYEIECTSICDFINAIYNVYKMRAVSLFISEAHIEEETSYTILIREINVVFYDEYGQVLERLESGNLKPMNPKVFSKSSPQFMNENRLSCLNEILYVPNGEVLYYDSELSTLPTGIKISDNNWRKIKKPNNELEDVDLLFIIVNDFEVYYLLNYELYKQLLIIDNFEIEYFACPIFKGYDTDFFESLDTNQIPTIKDKMKVLDDIAMGDLFYPIAHTWMTISDVNSFLQNFIFTSCILGYVMYFSYKSYDIENESNKGKEFKIRSFILLHKSYRDLSKEIKSKSLVLTTLELDYNTKMDYMTKIMSIGE